MSHEHELFKQAIDKWGRQSQIDMMIEECSELIKALCKLKRKHEPADTASLVNDICEEIADVQIVAGQMRHVFGAEEVDDWYGVKLNRLQDLLNR
jgi:NTP pyrophosphatase (non-canonical NTP hydrolase)